MRPTAGVSRSAARRSTHRAARRPDGWARARRPDGRKGSFGGAVGRMPPAAAPQGRQGRAGVRRRCARPEAVASSFCASGESATCMHRRRRPVSAVAPASEFPDAVRWSGSSSSRGPRPAASDAGRGGSGVGGWLGRRRHAVVGQPPCPANSPALRRWHASGCVALPLSGSVCGSSAPQPAGDLTGNASLVSVQECAKPGKSKLSTGRQRWPSTAESAIR